MPAPKPILVEPLLTRALNLAIALENAALVSRATTCRELLKGRKPSEIRAELEELRRFQERIEPRHVVHKGQLQETEP